MHTLLALLALGPLACTDGELELDDTSTEADADTDADSDSDTDADSDSDSDADTDPVTETLGFTIDGEADGLTVEVQRVDFAGDGAFLGMAGTGVIAGGKASVTVENPASDSLDAFIDGYDTVGAFYLVSIFDDADASGAYEAGEEIWGVGPASVLYLEGVEGELGFIVSDGWQGFEDEGADLPTIHVKSNIPLATNLAPQALAFSGTTDLPLPDEDGQWRLGLFSGAQLDGDTSVTPLYDALVSDSFSLELSDAPPADHANEDGLIEVPIAYYDTNLSGSLDQSSEFGSAHTMCLDGQISAAAWLEMATSYELAGFYLEEGFRGGWNLITIAGEGVTPVPQEDLNRLAFDGSCSFPEE
ncbi:MAG: hypothetical protein VX899_18675 [Myxococcota bacterium]|nr:hypothetical protein [Myxococcota bacterium]